MASTRSPLNIAPDDDPGGAPLTSWYTQGVTDGFGDRLLMFDNAATGPIELLRIRPEFATVPGFESALRSRFSQLTTFNHPGFAQARVVNHLDNGGGLTVASTHVTGTRLAALFEASRPSPGMHPGAVREVFGELVSAIGDLHAFGAGIAHGALSADHVILTFDRRLIVTDYVFGSALDRLRLPAARLWDEFGLVGDPASGRVQLDQRGDLTQLGLLMLCLVLGRRVTPDEYPERVPSLLHDFTAASDRRAPDLTSTMRGWLEQAIDPTGFESVSDAAGALAQWPARPHYIDLHAGPTPRALAPAQPTAVPPEDAAVVAAPAPAQVETPTALASAPAVVDGSTVASETLHVEHDGALVDTAEIDIEEQAAADAVVDAPVFDTLDTAPVATDVEPAALVEAAPAFVAAAAAGVEPEAAVTADAVEPAARASEIASPATAPDAARLAASDVPEAVSVATPVVADAHAEVEAHPAASAPIADAPVAATAAADAAALDEVAPVTAAALATSPVAEPALDAAPVVEEHNLAAPANVGEGDDLAAVRAAAAAAFGAAEAMVHPVAPVQPAEPPAVPATPVDVRKSAGPDLFDIDSRMRERDIKSSEDDARRREERIESVVRVPIPETPPASARPTLDSPLFRPLEEAPPAAAVDAAASTLPRPAAAAHSSFILPEPPAPTSAPDATPSLRFIKLGSSAPAPVPAPAPLPPLAAPSAAPVPVPFAWASEEVSSDEPEEAIEAEVQNASSPILKWAVAALVTLAVGQGLVIFQLLGRQPRGPVGRIHVDSPTPGDTVLLDGKAIGVTPLDVPLASPDSVVQVVPRGKETATAPETTPPAIPAAVQTPRSGNVGAPDGAKSVTTDTARGRNGGVRVVSPIPLQVMAGKDFLGSSDQGPVFTAPGTRELDFVNNTVGFRTTQRVQVQAGQIVAVRIEPPNGLLSVTAQPSAQVWIDGRRVGDTPIVNLSISLGEHEVVFRNPKLGERRQKALVQTNTVTRISASFNP